MSTKKRMLNLDQRCWYKMKNKLLYGETGGIRVGHSYWFSSNYTWPFAKLRVYKNKIVIKYRFSNLELRKKDITFIEKYQGLLGFFGRGIRIYHNKTKLPKFIVFWSFNPDNTLNEFRKRGYNLIKSKK